jgi:diguanylate cyclase (GGDEF)-like protein
MTVTLPRAQSTPLGGVHTLDAGWRWWLMIGFAALLLLILFVTGIGHTQIESAHTRLEQITDVYTQKLDATQRMHAAARARTLLLHQIILSSDAFERDGMRMAFERHGVEFIQARERLQALGLSERERGVLDALSRQILRALPIQQEIIDLTYAERLEAAKQVLVEQAIPMQNDVLDTLAELEALSRKTAEQATQRALEHNRKARALLLGTCATALVTGLLVAVYAFRRVKEAYRQRELLATHDPLTGLPNRRLLYDRLDQAIARSKRDRSMLAVMFIDLDKFKQVNDTLGHPVGDELIRAVAERLRGCLRASDTVARLGGDEFVVIAGDLHRVEEAIQVARHVLDAMNRPFHVAGHELHTGCSIGLSLYPDDGEDPETLLGRADVALYHAKEDGRGRCRSYSPAMQASPGAASTARPAAGVAAG